MGTDTFPGFVWRHAVPIVDCITLAAFTIALAADDGMLPARPKPEPITPEIVIVILGFLLMNAVWSVQALSALARQEGK